MTTKEIAQAVGKDERSVQRWVKALADKVSSVNDKMSSSSPMKPADYDLAETCLIIEEGLGKASADVYRTNAVHAAVEQKQPRLTGALVNALLKAERSGAISRDQFQIMIGAPREEVRVTPSHTVVPLQIGTEATSKIKKQVIAVGLKAANNARRNLTLMETGPGNEHKKTAVGAAVIYRSGKCR